MSHGAVYAGPAALLGSVARQHRVGGGTNSFARDPGRAGSGIDGEPGAGSGYTDCGAGDGDHRAAGKRRGENAGANNGRAAGKWGTARHPWFRSLEGDGDSTDGL